MFFYTASQVGKTNKANRGVAILAPQRPSCFCTMTLFLHVFKLFTYPQRTDRPTDRPTNRPRRCITGLPQSGASNNEDIRHSDVSAWPCAWTCTVLKHKKLVLVLVLGLASWVLVLVLGLEGVVLGLVLGLVTSRLVSTYLAQQMSIICWIKGRLKVLHCHSSGSAWSLDIKIAYLLTVVLFSVGPVPVWRNVTIQNTDHYVNRSESVSNCKFADESKYECLRVWIR